MAALAGDREFQPFLSPGAAVLAWDAEGARLLWASPSAVSLSASLAHAAGSDVPARAQLRALARGLAPSQGVRLERLRFDRSRLTPPLTCACRRVTLPSGEGALVTAIVGPLPAPVRAGPASSGADEAGVATTLPVADAEVAGPVPRAEPAPLASRPHGTVRFLWHMDASGRFTERSDALAEVVGRAGAAIVGRTWDEVATELVHDPDGAVSKALAGGKTWSGATVRWRVAGTDRAVAVDLAGSPVFDRNRAFQGFRGFGLCRTDAAAEPPQEPVQAPAVAPEPTSHRVEPIEIDEGQASSERPAETASAQRAPRPPEPRSLPHLSAGERAAFREIARALGARFGDGENAGEPDRRRAEIVPAYEVAHAQAAGILDSLPFGLLVCRGDAPLFANRFLLDLSGHGTLAALAEDGGLGRLFPGRSPGLVRSDTTAQVAILSTDAKESLAVDVTVASVSWEGSPASAFVIRPLGDHDPVQRLQALELDRLASDARLSELSSVLDTATDGVIMLDGHGRILSLNRSAEALFGYDQREVAGESLTVLLSRESHEVARDYLDSVQGGGVTSLLNDGREVRGRVRQGGTIPLFMTVGRTGGEAERKSCAVLRDITALKKAEAELLAAKRAAEEANAGRSDFLAKVSHEVRTPLNAIIGFAEVMLEERFGRLGNERYRDYLKDIHESGRRVLALVGDLLDLAEIEAGRMELSFTGVSLNDVVAASVNALLQQAARDRIVVRTSFAAKLPPVVADERSVRQIVVNVVSNAVKFTAAGGQVIVSTAWTDAGEVVVRVRDTGIGMTEQDIEAALEPLRQLATARKGSGSGLGLPLTKALVEANRARLHITSAPNEGTLVEIIFPPTRVLAD